MSDEKRGIYIRSGIVVVTKGESQEVISALCSARWDAV